MLADAQEHPAHRERTKLTPKQAVPERQIDLLGVGQARPDDARVVPDDPALGLELAPCPPSMVPDDDDPLLVLDDRVVDAMRRDVGLQGGELLGRQRVEGLVRIVRHRGIIAPGYASVIG